MNYEISQILIISTSNVSFTNFMNESGWIFFCKLHPLIHPPVKKITPVLFCNTGAALSG